MKHFRNASVLLNKISDFLDDKNSMLVKVKWMNTIQKVSRFIVIMSKGFIERKKKKKNKTDMNPSYVTLGNLFNLPMFQFLIYKMV